MRVVIATVCAPFVRGGAEMHAEQLRNALRAAGHEADIVATPFKWYPPRRIVQQMQAARLFDLSEAGGLPVDRLIGLRFPAYLIPHKEKTLWILHQHRQAYDLWDHPLGDLQHHPDGLQVRDAIRHADRRVIAEARHVYANSRNVARRMKHYCDLPSTPLYHPPPHADLFYVEPPEDYLYFPSRINPTKRQALIVRALGRTREKVRIRFSGGADSPEFERECKALAASEQVADRVEWLGVVSEEEKRKLYARCLGVLFPPVDEDYGYITLEAMLASKPVITCTDSGGPLEFVTTGETGLVCQPDPDSLAAAMDRLWSDREPAIRWGQAARDRYTDLKITWPAVVERLLA